MPRPSLQELRDLFVGQNVAVGGSQIYSTVCRRLDICQEKLLFVGSYLSIWLSDWGLEGACLTGNCAEEGGRLFTFTFTPPRCSMVLLEDLLVGETVVARPVIEVFQRLLNTPSKAAARLRGTKLWDAGDDQFMAIRQLLVSLKTEGFSDKWEDYEVILMPPEAAI